MGQCLDCFSSDLQTAQPFDLWVFQSGTSSAGVVHCFSDMGLSILSKILEIQTQGKRKAWTMAVFHIKAQIYPLGCIHIQKLSKNGPASCWSWQGVRSIHPVLTAVSKQGASVTLPPLFPLILVESQNTSKAIQLVLAKTNSHHSLYIITVWLICWKYHR